ncbi:type II secretion system major pseudopilin GspG [Neorhodopirellula pilleata]|uniref:Type II secretion system core protein G n=1 Tax=Neorhodopirellula pilleata TaxID=2714738 RepID=A0A5C6A4A2_9BACT|nr:type II secretion system major pseudopilin GspG [Neorhodopirellula pilleata]TWT94215.1 Type II secretion system protein G precursor [Neorhodopirellula pilleata]
MLPFSLTNYFCHARRFSIRKERTRGFTLMELLLVLAILLVMAGLVLPKLMGRQKNANIDATRISIEGLKQAIEMYAVDHDGETPSSSEGLSALLQKPGNDPKWRGPYLDRAPKDAWGHEFQYRYPATKSTWEFDVFSSGPDHLFGNEDDIGNWD